MKTFTNIFILCLTVGLLFSCNKKVQHKTVYDLEFNVDKKTWSWENDQNSSLHFDFGRYDPWPRNKILEKLNTDVNKAFRKKNQIIIFGSNYDNPSKYNDIIYIGHSYTKEYIISLSFASKKSKKFFFNNQLFKGQLLLPKGAYVFKITTTKDAINISLIEQSNSEPLKQKIPTKAKLFQF